MCQRSHGGILLAGEHTASLDEFVNHARPLAQLLRAALADVEDPLLEGLADDFGSITW